MKYFTLTFFILALCQEALATSSNGVPKRYRLSAQLGAVEGSDIERNPLISFKKSADDAAIESQIASAEITAGLNYAQARSFKLPTFTVPRTVAVEKTKSSGCAKTVLLSFEKFRLDLDAVEPESLVIFTSKFDSDKLDQPRIDKLKASWFPNKPMFGFQKKFPITAPVREILTQAGIAYFENLELPSASFDAQAVYYGFKQVFVPFANVTSTFNYDSHGATPDHINLASLYLVQGDQKIARFCTEMKAKVALLSQSISSPTTPLPGDVQPARFVEHKDGSREHWLQFSTQIGTHLVAPYRFNQTQNNVSDAISAIWFAPIVRVKMAPALAADGRVTKALIIQYEQATKLDIQRKSILLIETGFGALEWSKAETYTVNFPTLDIEAAKYLVETRKIAAIAMDTLSLDFQTHSYLADKNIPVILNVNVDDSLLPDASSGVRSIIVPLETVDKSAAPIAFFALPDFEANMGPPAQSRWQFGAIIKHNDDIVIRPVGEQGLEKADKARLLAKEISLTFDPARNKVTTFTTPQNMPVMKQSMQGCIPTHFIKSSDATVAKMKLGSVEPGQLVIFTNKDLSSLNSDVTKIIAERNIVIGMFLDSKLPENFSDNLVKAGISFFENLARPTTFVDAKISEQQVYYAFKFVFAAPDNETSLRKSLDLNPPRKINLADLVVFDLQPSSQDVYWRCTKPRASEDVRILSQYPGPASKVPVYSGVVPPQWAGNDSEKIMFSDHYATHFDAPFHFDANKFDTTALPYVQYDCPLYVKIKIPQASRIANYSIKVADLLKFEREQIKQAIPDFSIVLFDTDHANKWPLPSTYITEFPGLSLEAAMWLVEERDVVAIGIDSLTLDDFSLASKGQFPTHKYLASQSKLAIVNIGRDLDYAPGIGGRAVMAYLRYEQGTAAPLALFGLPDKPTSRPSLLDGPHTEATHEHNNEASSTFDSCSFILALLGASLFVMLF